MTSRLDWARSQNTLDAYCPGDRTRDCLSPNGFASSILAATFLSLWLGLARHSWIGAVSSLDLIWIILGSSLDQSCIQPGFAASYAPVSEHLHLARKRTVFLYVIAPIVCTVFLYTVHTWYEFRFIHDLARKRTVSESIYSTVSLYKHDWYTVYRVEMLRSYFNTASSGAQAHRIYCIYCIYCTVYTLLYIHTHHFERVTKIARRPSWMSGGHKMRNRTRTPKF